MYLPSLIQKTERERGQKDGDADRSQREAGGGGPTAGDGCDSSQVPKGPEENMALCSDNGVLSGFVCVCVSFLLQCALAAAFKPRRRLTHCTFR